MKKVKVGDFLEKNGLINKKILILDYHLNILNYPLEDLVFKIIREGYLKKGANLNETELATAIYNLILKTDADSKDYDIKVDSFLANLGLRLNQRRGSSVVHNKWNTTGLMDDDGFGFGTEPTSLNDKEVDFKNDRIGKMK